jgi:HAD superfamily hydrolase (TIGR01509 family)
MRLSAVRHEPSVVLFDLDSVLIDSGSVLRRAFECAWSEAGLSGVPPLSEFADRLGLPFPRILAELGLPQSMAGRYSRTSADLASEINTYPGVESVLEALRKQGWLIGVVTGKARARATDIFARTGLGNLIDALTTPDDGVGKPDAAAIWDCLNKIGPNRQAAFFVGDTAIDMEAARNAGVDGVFATWGAHRELARSSYWHRADSPRDLLDLGIIRNQPLSLNGFLVGSCSSTRRENRHG